MFVKNAWYVCAMSEEIGRRLTPRTILGAPIVLYRTQDGRPAALEDRCVHRRLPLSKGRLVGDIVQCGYHGLEYEVSGKCVRVPGQTTVPPMACLKSYPLVERHGWIFIWMGDPARAAQEAIPEFFKLADDPAWCVLRGILPIKCNHLLILDNLLDLSHLAYVHPSTIGNTPVAENALVGTKASGDRVRVTRVMTDVVPAQAYIDLGGYNGNINRWQITEYVPPGFYLINNGSESASRGTPTPERIEGQSEWGFQVHHGITPETASTTFQFWQIVFPRRAQAAEDRARFEKMPVLIEDLVVYEAQQRAIECLSERGREGAVNPVIAIEADAGLTHGRRILERMLREEANAGA